MDNFHNFTCGLRRGEKECTCGYTKSLTAKEREYWALVQERNDLKAERDALKKLLETIEYINIYGHDFCPVCQNNKNIGHLSKCYFAAALKEKP